MDFVKNFYLSHTWPVLAACVFGILIFIILFSILLYQQLIRSRDARLKRWDFIADHVIRDAIFFEESDLIVSTQGASKAPKSGQINISGRLKTLLKNKFFRDRLRQKIISAKLNMSGSASENLDRLFRQLDFTIDILIMLTSTRWYQEARALELIGIMQLQEHRHFLSENIDNPSGLVRMEAQNSILKFSGFEGLNFLTQTTSQLSDWQQIKLLNELSNLPHEDFRGISKWLSSSNDSVVIFALKIVRIYHRFELYDQVLGCLSHSNPEVRSQAINVLKALPNEESVQALTAIYPIETTRNKVEILRVFQSIAYESEIDFLLTQLDDTEFNIKLEAARGLQSLGNRGMDALSKYKSDKNSIIPGIIAQIEEEQR